MHCKVTLVSDSAGGADGQIGFPKNRRGRQRDLIIGLSAPEFDPKVANLAARASTRLQNWSAAATSRSIYRFLDASELIGRAPVALFADGVIDKHLGNHEARAFALGRYTRT